MSIYANILTGGINGHETTSENANQVATDFISEGIVGTLTNTSGVAPATGGFAVNAQGTPDMTVAVSAGVAYVIATPSGQASQNLRIYNNASANVTIAANSSGSTKYDWIYISISAANAAAPNAAGDNVATLVASRSSSATADDGTPPTYGYPLAVVTVANGASTIANGSIADKRTNSQVTSTVNSIDETTFDFIASGCVWTADAAGSTRLASMTAGAIYINGTRLTVAAVTSRTFTASRDVYVDFSDNGDGTALLAYTDNTTNAASPALAANSIRNAIVVVGASSIAASTSINQGQETRVLPIASSIPYAVTDSLGNLICPRDPNRKILGYRQILTAVTINTPTTATAVTGLSVPVIIPTGRKIKIYVDSGLGITNSGANASNFGFCLTSAADANRLKQMNTPATTGPTPVVTSLVVTPASASATYVAHVRAATGNVTTNGDSTSPAFIRVELE